METNLWTIILAAGDGTRLRSLARDENGTPVPKQFWRINGRTSMLQWSFLRAARWTSPSRTVAVVASAHRPFWKTELNRVSRRNIVVQPENRGTAAGILLPLLKVLSRDRNATVVIMPSDHYFDDEPVLESSVRRAASSLGTDSGRILLLGISAEEPDPELGYIVPGPGSGPYRPVETFVEKPSEAAARRLLEQGAVWNSFIIVARGAALLRLFAGTQTRLMKEFDTVLTRDGWSPAAIRTIYRDLPVLDFSRDVLQKRPDLLGVVVVPPCGWTDLGTPLRIQLWSNARRNTGAEVRVAPLRAGWPAPAPPRAAARNPAGITA